jgi:hypothetical protein
VGGWYLSYNPTGKDKRVFLSKAPAAGSCWDLDHLSEPGKWDTHVWAAAGALRGWSLDRGAKVGTEDRSEKRTGPRSYGEMAKKKGEKKRPQECEYQVTVSNKRKPPAFAIYEIGK